MKLNKQETDFIKVNKEILAQIFQKRIEELKEEMIIDTKNRDRIADLVVELKYWLQDIHILTKPRKKKTDNFV